MKADLKELNAKLRELLELLRAADAEDRQRVAELNSKETLLSVQQKLLSNKEEETKRFFSEIRSLKSSRSWRITAPLWWSISCFRAMEIFSQTLLKRL